MRVLVTNSQGVGDEILYLSGLKQVISDDTDVTLQCTNRLKPIVRKHFPGVFTAPLKKNPDLAGYDVVISNDKLAFKTPGYLKAEACARPPYSTARGAGKRIIGVSWYSHNHGLGAMKSARVRDFAPLLGLDNTLFVSLQYGDCRMELLSEGAGRVYIDPEVDPLRDLEAYMSQIAACDVVVTTSNTCLHVAGALGVKTLLLVPGDQDAPWYWKDMPYESVTVCRGEGEGWASQALNQAVSLL